MLLKHELLPLSDFCAEGAEGCHGVDMDKFINFPDCRFGSAVCPLAPVGGKEILVRQGGNHLINSLDIRVQRVPEFTEGLTGVGIREPLIQFPPADSI